MSTDAPQFPHIERLKPLLCSGEPVHSGNDVGTLDGLVAGKRNDHPSGSAWLRLREGGELKEYHASRVFGGEDPTPDEMPEG